MRFHREQFLTGAEDCAWVRATALKGIDTVPFASLTLAGNEDCPVRLDLYTSALPPYNEHPVAVYALEDGVLTLQPKVERASKRREYGNMLEVKAEPVTEKASTGPMVYTEGQTA